MSPSSSDSAVPSATSLLNLPLSDPSTLPTLLEELSPLPNTTPESLGFTGCVTSGVDFVAHMTLAHRILLHRRHQFLAQPSSEDLSLAQSITRMLSVLKQTASPVPGNCTAVSGVLLGIKAGVERDIQGRKCGEVFGGELVTRKEISDKMGVCEGVLGEMKKEHAVRMDMVRHRFEVCEGAFGRVGGLKKKRIGEEIGVFEVLGVRGWVLKWGRVERVGGVRGVRMGDVPDRGGRIGVGVGDGGNVMPGFKRREGQGRGRGRSKSSRGKRKRGR